LRRTRRETMKTENVHAGGRADELPTFQIFQ
jgi:hypothetical protein